MSIIGENIGVLLSQYSLFGSAARKVATSASVHVNKS